MRATTSSPRTVARSRRPISATTVLTDLAAGVLAGGGEAVELDHQQRRRRRSAPASACADGLRKPARLGSPVIGSV